MGSKTMVYCSWFGQRTRLAIDFFDRFAIGSADNLQQQ